MQTKSKIIIIFFYIFNFLIFDSIANSDEFNISAEVISVDKENNIVVGKGSVEVTDAQGKIIRGNKITYKKSKVTYVRSAF